MRQIKLGIIDISYVMQLPPEKRTHEQAVQLSYYLHEKVPFFGNQDFPDRDFMVSIAEVVKFEEFEQNTVIMRMGDLGDKMYFSIRGRLGIFLSKEVEGDPVAVIPEFSTVGERALKSEDDRRSATVVCLDAGVTHCLSLTKKDYQRLVYVSYFISIIYFFIFIRDHI